MEPLVEVCSVAELGIALDAGAVLIGVNNRNLRTFEVDMGTTSRVHARLAELGAEDRVTLVSLSGVASRTDVAQYLGIARGVLVGEHLMLATDPGAEVERLRGVSARLPIVKICGLTTEEDARAAVRAGCSMIGLVFVPSSRRFIPAARGAAIASAVRSLAHHGTGTDAANGAAAASARLRAARTPAQLQRALRGPPATCSLVGVFSDQSVDAVNAIAREVGLDAVQLCGSEDVSDVSQYCVPVFKTIHVDADARDMDRRAVGRELVARVRSLYERGVSLVLVDTGKAGGATGGTGVPFDWAAATALAAAGLPFLVTIDTLSSTRCASRNTPL
jgi:anthranilate synthase/indole-3-glycerol phosphate synthase/phosphoribosylanthranilate isomerase